MDKIRKIIDSSYKKGSIDTETFLKANIQYSNILEKGGSGEGSKGGKVIGHTRSGKPIYENGSHSNYANFHEDDHHESSYKHSSLAESARVEKNSHETLNRIAQERGDKEGAKHHAEKSKEAGEREMHHSAHAQYHAEEARPHSVKDRYSEIGKRVGKIKKG